jgi:orotate phosphoribosyltransferase
VRESIALIQAAGASPHAVVIALDRQEKATENGADLAFSAVQYVTNQLGLKVCAIAQLTDLLQYLDKQSSAGASGALHFKAHYQAVLAYRERYGVE